MRTAIILLLGVGFILLANDASALPPRKPAACRATDSGFIVNPISNGSVSSNGINISLAPTCPRNGIFGPNNEVGRIIRTLLPGNRVECDFCYNAAKPAKPVIPVTPPAPPKLPTHIDGRIEILVSHMSFDCMSNPNQPVTFKAWCGVQANVNEVASDGTNINGYQVSYYIKDSVKDLTFPNCASLNNGLQWQDFANYCISRNGAYVADSVVYKGVEAGDTAKKRGEDVRSVFNAINNALMPFTTPANTGPFGCGLVPPDLGPGYCVNGATNQVHIDPYNFFVPGWGGGAF